MAMLELRDITRAVTLPNGETLEILRGVNLDVNPGDHISIVGHSGTGKSTLLNIIGMLDQPNSGTYTWNGQDMRKLSDAERSRKRGSSIGFVFQQFNLFSTRDTVSNVAVPLLYNAGPALFRRHTIAAQMLESVELGHRLHAMPSQLSGGEQQRVAIARALIRKPTLILADEPTGALDPHTGALVMNVLENAARENNAALIVITHDMGVAKRADAVYEIADGVLHDASHLPGSVLVESVPLESDGGELGDDTAAGEPEMTISEPDTAASEPETAASEPETAASEPVTPSPESTDDEPAEITSEPENPQSPAEGAIA